MKEENSHQIERLVSKRRHKIMPKTFPDLVRAVCMCGVNFILLNLLSFLPFFGYSLENPI